ncbi:MAG: hypothetical protein R3E53_01490 [Myxococcota bacterium]
MPMLVAGLATGLACAQTPRSVEPPDVHGRAIELGSRCLESTPSGLANVPLPADAHRAVLPGGLDAVVVASPYAVRESLRISLPRSAFASPSWARAVLLAWSTGELAAEPEALRRAMRAGGVSTRAGLAGDRGFLAFEFPAGRLDDAIAALARLFEATPIGDGPWAVLRPELALLLMAEELAPTTAARRLRQAVEDGPEAARAAGARAALDGLDPATLHAALQRGLATPGVLVAYAAHAPSAADGFDRLVAGLERAPGRSIRFAARDRAPRASQASGEARAPDPTDPDPSDATSTRDDRPILHVLDQPGARQVELLASRRTPGLDGAARATLEMLASLLGDATAGRLFEDLRQRQALAYEIGAVQAADHFEVRTRTRPERVAALVTGIEAHWVALGSVPLEPCEVALLHDRMRGALALEADAPSARLDALLEGFDREDALPTLAERADRYAAISREHLEWSADALSATPPDWYLVGDAETLADRLLRAFPERVIRIHDAGLERIRERAGR